MTHEKDLADRVRTILLGDSYEPTEGFGGDDPDNKDIVNAGIAGGWFAMSLSIELELEKRCPATPLLSLYHPASDISFDILSHRQPFILSHFHRDTARICAQHRGS